MTHRIKEVRPLENMMIMAVFQNGVVKQYDMRKLYPIFPQFMVLETMQGLFEQVNVDVGGYGISWNDELDLDAEEIWDDGIEIEFCKVDAIELLATNLLMARKIAGMTQKQLSSLTGIYQADISKIERGLANPSISTLEKLAGGMGMTLKVEFVKE